LWRQLLSSKPDTEQERAAQTAIKTIQTSGDGYFVEQSTRPQTTGYALLDVLACRTGDGFRIRDRRDCRTCIRREATGDAARTVVAISPSLNRSRLCLGLTQTALVRRD
jgi:hypothetical protein